MKQFKFLSLLIVSILLIQSGINELQAAEETRNLPAFSSIGIAISADVFYSSGSKHEIVIQGDSRDVNDLITEVKNGKLQVKYNDWKVKRSKLTIYISSEELEGVSVSGSAHFKAEKLSTEEMSIALSGSGEIYFPSLEAEEVGVRISGSGNAVLEDGSSEEMDVRISGSGKLKAELFAVEEFEASISGSGSCRITVKDELNARISGSGGVYYHGNPRIDASSSGSGKVRSL